MICSPGPRDRACGQLTVVTATNTRPGQQAASVVWPGEWREDQETCADITVVTSAGRSRPVTTADTVPAQSVLSDVVNTGTRQPTISWGLWCLDSS